jgi:glutathione reductase (NADPH)
MPTVVFASPPLAAVGMREDEARAQGLRFDTRYEQTSSWSSSRRAGEDCSAHKILIEHGSGRILGAHLLGPGADETINLFALAMAAELTASELKRTLFAYPTYGSDVSSML